VARLAQVELSVAAGVVLVARLVQVELVVPAGVVLVARLVQAALVVPAWAALVVPAWAALVVLVAKGALPALLLATVVCVRCTLCATQVTIRWPWELDETSSFPPETAQRSASAIL
jgi:uncharacterized membrane protein YdfJ with MMPL/SSD domain